ncbi:hypothetical protein [Lyngbya aestuarii]|uniref:hypothetical protein n=1 Tax=Lyngbya aestuarii TaxID=118322 RepID=UPI00403D99B2
MIIFTRIVGFVVLLIGLYFLKEKVDFFDCWQRHTSIIQTVFVVLAGFIGLLLSQKIKYFGLIVVTFICVVALASGCVRPRPIMLWNFFLGVAGIGIGLKMLITGSFVHLRKIPSRGKHDLE